MSDRTAIRMDGQRSSGLLTTVAVLAPRDRADRPAGSRPRGGHDDQRDGRPAPALDRARARRRPAAERVDGPPARVELLDQVAALPGDEDAARARAAGTPARRGRAGPRRHARSRTASAPRCAGSRASASARTAATATGAGPGVGRPRATAATAVSRNRAFLPVDSTSSARAPAARSRAGSPGRPPPEPRSTNASIPADAERAAPPSGCRGRARRRPRPGRGSRSD